MGVIHVNASWLFSADLLQSDNEYRESDNFAANGLWFCG
jgi:hypothetical protein